jgi:hypothetical protein
MFDIATCTDFYSMLVQDFDDYMSETHSARKALNCAIAAYIFANGSGKTG